VKRFFYLTLIVSDAAAVIVVSFSEVGAIRYNRITTRNKQGGSDNCRVYEHKHTIGYPASIKRRRVLECTPIKKDGKQTYGQTDYE
jgi:hypothetical protein